MQKSDSIKELATAMSKFQGSMEAITKDATNPFFKSKYASLSNIIEDTRAPLSKAGLSYAQFPSGDSELTTILMHTSGEYMAASYQMKPTDPKPQSVGSAITYARRYALCAILGLQVEDDDGNEASKPKRHYDHTPIEDDAAVVVSGADDINDIVPTKPRTTPAKTKTVAEKKREIKDLIDGITLNMLETKKDFEDYVKTQTGLELVASNYDAIIERLKALA